MGIPCGKSTRQSWRRDHPPSPFHLLAFTHTHTHTHTHTQGVHGVQEKNLILSFWLLSTKPHVETKGTQHCSEKQRLCTHTHTHTHTHTRTLSTFTNKTQSKEAAEKKTELLQKAISPSLSLSL